MNTRGAATRRPPRPPCRPRSLPPSRGLSESDPGKSISPEWCHCYFLNNPSIQNSRSLRRPGTIIIGQCALLSADAPTSAARKVHNETSRDRLFLLPFRGLCLRWLYAHFFRAALVVFFCGSFFLSSLRSQVTFEDHNRRLRRRRGWHGGVVLMQFLLQQKHLPL